MEQIMEQKIKSLDQLSDLYSKIKSDPNDYIRKNDVLQHLEWSMSHLADSIWHDTTTL